MPHIYNDPAGGNPSTVGSQFRTDHIIKRALIEAQRSQYFMQLADTKSMPKHMGKKLKQYHYMPLLDDRNDNDQGIDASGATIANGNLYGSSKDIGAIPAKLPTLTEMGGRVNRVGFTRLELEGTLEKFGFFDEYTQESLDFDTDAELAMHVNREMLNGASEITEDALQIDLLNSAGVLRYAGTATDTVEITASDKATYDDLVRLSIDLDDNRTPKQTTIIKGTRLIDTQTIPGARIMYVGSELLPLFKAMTDYHGERAWVPVQKYAAGGTVLRGEEGSVDNFRIVVVPEMMHYADAGAAGIDVYPMLVVGDQSFSTIGFQTDGKTVKFKITNKKPGIETADRTDPYGEIGFMSIKWYYGFLLQRPERIALMKTAA